MAEGVGRHFVAGWRAVPFWQGALTVAASPLVGLDRMAFGSRRALARDLELSDADRFVDSDSMEELMALLGDQRDRLLIAELDEIHRQRSSSRYWRSATRRTACRHRLDTSDGTGPHGLLTSRLGAPTL